MDLLFERPMYVAPFERVPGLGRFILRDEGVIMGMGRIVELKQKHWCVCLGDSVGGRCIGRWV